MGTSDRPIWPPPLQILVTLWPSKMSRRRLPPAHPPLLSPLPPSLRPLHSLRKPSKPLKSIEKQRMVTVLFSWRFLNLREDHTQTKDPVCGGVTIWSPHCSTVFFCMSSRAICVISTRFAMCIIVKVFFRIGVLFFAKTSSLWTCPCDPHDSRRANDQSGVGAWRLEIPVLERENVCHQVEFGSGSSLWNRHIVWLWKSLAWRVLRFWIGMFVISYHSERVIWFCLFWSELRIQWVAQPSWLQTCLFTRPTWILMKGNQRSV